MWLLNTLVILSALGVVFGDGDADVNVDDGIVVLKTDTFEPFIKENDYVLVEFLIENCDRCDTLYSESIKAIAELEEKGTKIIFSKVNGDDETQLTQDYNLQGYPTLKFFRKGTALDYPLKVNNTAEEILNWLIKKTGFPATEIKSVAGAEEFINSQPVAIIGFFDDRETDSAKTFIKVADAVDDYPFGFTSNKEVYAKYEAKSGSIILFKNFDDGNAVFGGEMEEEEIKTFFAQRSMSLIVDFSRETAQKIGTAFRDIKSHLLFFVSKSAGHYEEYLQPAKDVAKQFRDNVLFMSIDVDDEGHKRFMTMFGLKTDEFPSMLLVRNDQDMPKYKPATPELSVDNIRSFVQGFLDGKMKQHLPSQELPEDWDQTPVKTLVGTNFDEVVFNSGKDVLVEFYAPWCTVCQELAPKYDELGELYKDSTEFIIAKFDTTANELSHTRVTNVPTLKFYKRGNSTGIDFKGTPTLEGLVHFLESGGVQEVVEQKFANVELDNSNAEGDKNEEEEEGDTLPKEEL